MDTQQQKYERGVYCLDDIPKHLRKHFKPAQASWDFFGVAWQLKRVLKPGGVIVWVVADATKDGSETGSSMEQALHFKRLGLNLHDTMIYKKSFCPIFDGRQGRYKPIFEYMSVLSSGRPKTANLIKDTPNKTAGRVFSGKKGRDKNGELREQNKQVCAEFQVRSAIWEYETGANSSDEFSVLHPATFPLVLARDHIATWSNPGDLVLDPFSGSGTTAKAAKELGRRFLGLEINPEYCAIAERRIAQQVLELEAV